MGINPYATLGNALGTFGSNDASESLKAGAQAQRSVEQKGGMVERNLKKLTGFNSHPTRGAIAGRNSNSLPGIRTSKGVTGQGQKTGGGVSVEPFYLGAFNYSSITVHLRSGGGVETVFKAVSVYTPFISEVGWKKLERIVVKMAKRAESLSKGRLTYKDLRKKNHPYGMGPYARPKLVFNRKRRVFVVKNVKRRGLGKLTRMRGISNLAVVNKHRGDFEAGWLGLLERTSTGAIGRLINLTQVSEWLAFGTVKMRAHGPFLTAVQLYKPEFNQAWKDVNKQAYEAYLRSRTQ